MTPPLQQDYSYTASHSSVRPDLARWLQAAEARAQARLRAPVVMAAQRIGLTSRRCDELSAHAKQIRHQLLNPPGRPDHERVAKLEDRALSLEKEAHAERVALWRDLMPLAESARDAAVDRIRLSWLSELERVIGGGGVGVDGEFGAILHESGFRRLGELRSRLEISLFWSDAHRCTLVTVQSDGRVVLKGVRAYRLVAMADEAATWMRDIGGLHEYLRTHFADLHLSFSWFRDVSPGQAARSALKRQPTAAHASAIDELDQAIDGVSQSAASLETASGLFDDDLLRLHVGQEQRRLRSERERLESSRAAALEDHRIREGLVEAYLRRGSAARLTFSVASGVHEASDPGGLETAVRSVVHELEDLDRYQVRQKLGGRLRIEAVDALRPEIDWLELWFGGSFSARELERQPGLDGSVCEQLTESQEVVGDGDQPGLAPDDQSGSFMPRVVASLLDGLAGSEPAALRQQEPPQRSLALGVRTERGTDGARAHLSIDRIQNAAVSGATQSGKTFAARVLVEEAAGIPDLHIVVIDPRNQWSGLTVPEDRPELVRLLREETGERPASFGFECSHGTGAALDADDGDPMRRIVSFHGVGESDRCDGGAELLEDLFRRFGDHQSHQTRLLIVIDEVHAFTPSAVPPEARAAARRFCSAADRIAREGVKYGMCIVFCTQSLRDLARELAGARQNTTTKIFFRNADREVDAARGYLDDPRDVMRLQTREAIAVNPELGPMRIRVRPPRSKVWDFGLAGPAETGEPIGEAKSRLSEDAARVFDLLAGLDDADHAGPGVNVSDLGRLTGITSRRRLHRIVAELEEAGLIRTHRLPERGQPRVIRLTGS